MFRVTAPNDEGGDGLGSGAVPLEFRRDGNLRDVCLDSTMSELPESCLVVMANPLKNT